MRKISLAALVALGFAVPALAQAAEPTKLRYTLDWRYQGNLAEFMYAKSGGFYAREGLDVQLDSGAGSGATITRIVGGSHDCGNADLNTVIAFMGNNPGIANFKAVYLVYSRTPMIVQTLKRTGIVKPQDLAGKTMASPEYDATRAVFPLFARAVGVDPASIKWLNVEPALRENLLARGDVDAIPGMEIDRLTLMERGVKADDIRTFKFTDYGVNFYGHVILCSDKFIAAHPAAVKGLLRATDKAIIASIEHPDKAAAAVHDFDALTDPKADLEKLEIQLRVVDTPFAREHGLGAIDKQQLDKQVAEVVDVFHTKTKPDPDKIFDLSFLPPKADRMPPK